MDQICDMTGRRELFIDDFLIASKRYTEFKPHFPVELPMAPARAVGNYVTVMKTPEGYNIYYRGTDGVYRGSTFNNNPGEFVGFAQSQDGIVWEEPRLDRFPGKPVPPNTLFYGKEFITHNFVPFFDSNPECQENERYKAVAGVRETKGLFAYSSPDGINWKLLHEKPVMEYTPEKTGGHMLDSQNVVFYSECEKCYAMYIRVWKTADGLTGVRSFAKVTSKDFRTWSEPEFLTVNRKREHLYVSGLAPYPRAPRIYAGAATRYFGTRGSATDVTMVFSREGKGIIRPWKGAWITPGLEEDRWLNRMNYIAWGMAEGEGKYLYMFHSRKPLMYRFRLDGFVSLSAGLKCGNVLTRPFYREKGDLELNLATSAGGSFQIEVCGSDGNVLPGYSFKENKPFWGDKICWTPEWEGKKFSNLPPGRYSLRFRMKECDLYSINFPE